MTILHCSANIRKKLKMTDSQSLLENQLKQHVLVWVITTLLIKSTGDTNSLYWHQNTQIKFPIKFWTFWCQFHILFANELHKIRNHKNKISGTSAKNFGNPSHDDIQKLTDKSKKVIPIYDTLHFGIAIWYTSYHTCVHAIWHIVLLSLLIFCILFYSPKCSWGKSQKYEKLKKCLPHCTQHST